jgi:hypothetical protein
MDKHPADTDAPGRHLHAQSGIAKQRRYRNRRHRALPSMVQVGEARR